MNTRLQIDAGPGVVKPYPVVSAENVTHYYGKRRALDQVSFALNGRGTIGLLGVNGAGKSTLMNIITGVITATGGSVYVCGHGFRTNSIEAKRNLSFLPQSAPLYLDLTIMEFLDYCAKLKGIPRSLRRGKISAAMHRCGIESRGNSLIGSLSGGLRQRVGIAQALISKPPLIVLDEPTNGLDPNQIKSVRELIREIARDTLVMISTHILREVEAVCDEILVLHGGRLVFCGDVGKFISTLPSSTAILVTEREVPSSLECELNLTKAERRGCNPTYRLDRVTPSSQSLFNLIDSLRRVDVNVIELIREESSIEDVFTHITRQAD